MLPTVAGVERPRNPGHGDYASNLALQVARKAGLPPRDLAQAIADKLTSDPAIQSVEIAGPGFLNIRLVPRGRGNSRRCRRRAGRGLRARDGAGRTARQPRVRLGQPDRADPHRRGAVGGRRRRAGQAAARPGRHGRHRVLLQRRGRADRSVRRLAARRRAAASRPPRTATPASTSARSSGRCSTQHPDLPRPARLSRPRDLPVRGRRADVRRNQDLAGRLRRAFRRLLRRTGTARPGRARSALARLRQSGHVYEADGATWVRTTDSGDDKDRVYIRSER